MDIIDTLESGERVTSTYAENYFDDEYSPCKNGLVSTDSEKREDSKKSNTSPNGFRENWISPSDLLIGIIELTPPFTSKITRGITHEGIISIGNGMLAKERQKFETELRRLLRDNDASWNHILLHEKQQVKLKVRKCFKKIFEEKSKIMTSEIEHFYEKCLLELENHLRSEIQHVLVSAHANITSDLNIEINKRLKEEKCVLETVLEKQYRSEINKITKYYKIMSDYELNRNGKIISKALHERNDALNAFYKQIEAETMTSTMYVMSMERKKCKIKQFLLENYQNSEIKERLEKIQAKEEIIDSYKQRERFIADINFEWKEKIKKIVQLFLKFISFSLKLLPEQTTFLLDLEKLFVLQLNEIQKHPQVAPQILVEVENNLNNIFHFNEPNITCDKEPFEVIGDTSESIPTPYGSRETLPSHVELPAITVLLEKKFVYAKCNKFDEIKALLESCKCLEEKACTCFRNKEEETPSNISVSESASVSSELYQGSQSIKSESSIELMQVDDIKRMQDCPYKNCRDWTKQMTLDISNFVEFTEENFKVVQNRYTFPLKEAKRPKLTSAKEIAHKKLPFVEGLKQGTSYHDAVTQCSSDEDMPFVKIFEKDVPECTCVKKHSSQQLKDYNEKESRSKLINEIMVKRRISMQRLLFSNPNLLKMFTDESFDIKI
ncbi:uncharacterized protein LOC133516982 [Cydia pomonella]|uniref:uncharacterized protein LOC133516982 n=1 Tax=Cydia pomonella TaxID=82600 RepID=UPI002ADD6D17|nr:uncharacterized protein LOC133516982 [Cydia pomonella]